MNLNYKNAVERVLCSEKDIQDKVKIIARDIENYYKDSEKKLLFLGILKGSVVFMADLMKEVHLPIEVDFMRLSSYGKGAVSSGNIVIKAGLEKKDLSEYNVLIVEDILDTGNTLFWLVDYLKREHGCEDIKIRTPLKGNWNQSHKAVYHRNHTAHTSSIFRFAIDDNCCLAHTDWCHEIGVICQYSDVTCCGTHDNFFSRTIKRKTVRSHNL